MTLDQQITDLKRFQQQELIPVEDYVNRFIQAMEVIKRLRKVVGMQNKALRKISTFEGAKPFRGGEWHNSFYWAQDTLVGYKHLMRGE